MTIRTIRSNRQESDHIADDKLRYVIRSSGEKYNVNDIIQFQCYEHCKPVYHRNNKYMYVITLTQDFRTVPIDTGAQLISFRRMA